jgi:hypothetical protein
VKNPAREPITTAELRRAAKRLKAHAAILRNSYADRTNGWWTGDPEMGYTAKIAERDYLDHLYLADQLIRHARQISFVNRAGTRKP